MSVCFIPDDAAPSLKLRYDFPPSPPALPFVNDPFLIPDPFNVEAWRRTPKVHASCANSPSSSECSRSTSPPSDDFDPWASVWGTDVALGPPPGLELEVPMAIGHGAGARGANRAFAMPVPHDLSPASPVSLPLSLDGISACPRSASLSNDEADLALAPGADAAAGPDSGASSKGRPESVVDSGSHGSASPVSPPPSKLTDACSHKRATGLPPQWSQGALLHGGGLCTPCGFYHTSGCVIGKTCTFCHLCPKMSSRILKRIRARNSVRQQQLKAAAGELPCDKVDDNVRSV